MRKTRGRGGVGVSLTSQLSGSSKSPVCEIGCGQWRFPDSLSHEQNIKSKI